MKSSRASEDVESPPSSPPHPVAIAAEARAATASTAKRGRPVGRPRSIRLVISREKALLLLLLLRALTVERAGGLRCIAVRGGRGVRHLGRLADGLDVLAVLHRRLEVRDAASEKLRDRDVETVAELATALEQLADQNVGDRQ